MSASVAAPPVGTARWSVLLLDDHRVFTDLLALTLGMQPDMRCTAVAHSLREGLATAAAVDFDVAIVDLHLPDGNGIGAVAQLRALGEQARVIVLTAHPRPDLVERALADGAVAFLPKDGTLSDILTAIRSADEAHPVVGALGTSAAAPPRLTRRERDVLDGLARGLDAGRLAAELSITLYTVRDHIKSLLAKLEVHTQLDAVLTARRLGLVELDGPY